MAHLLTTAGFLKGCLIFIVSGGLWVSEAQAQPEPMRWGDIPDAHAAMESYPVDSLAGAVILGSYAEIRIEQDLKMTFDVHRRIKLFSESSYNLATVEFPYVSRRGYQRVPRIDGHTFIRDADGSLQRIELHRSDIHEEEDGDITLVRFTLPALEPGAIIEYRYRIQTRSAITLPNFLFQDEEPVLWSEFRVRYPAFLTINRHPIGSPDFHIEEIDVRSARSVNRYATRLRWVMTDVPALHEEPYVASVWNHAYGMQFQLAGFTGGDGIFRSRSQTWQEIATQLRRHEDFGRRLRAPRALRRQVAELTADAETDAEKLHRIYDFVRTNIEWDDRYRFMVRRSLNDVLDEGVGTSAEINFVLIAMLREAGIEADPVLISTRRNGRTIGWFASTGQFNHVIAHAVAGGEELFLDATDTHRPAGMLPEQALNVEGWRLRDVGFGWMPIQPDRSVTALEVEAEISLDGHLSGSIAARFEGYPALQRRHRLFDADDEEARGEAVAGETPMTFDAIVIEGLANDGELHAELTFESEEHAQAMAHLLTFNPIVLGGMTQNPFAAPERRYPVDFAYPILHNYTATIRIPDGYVVDALPQHVRLETPGDGVRYARVVTFAGGNLRIQRTLEVNQTYFEPDEYAALRDVYEEITAADASVIVLARTEPPHAEGE